MNNEPKIQKTYSVEEMFSMAQQKKKSSNGRGAGLWLTSWGLIIFAFIAFEQWVTPLNALVWLFHVAVLSVLLMGTLLLAMSFDQKENK